MQHHAPCERFQLALVDALPSTPHLTGELREHAQSCAACARALRAWPAASRALSELPRQAAPSELDSAVVAAFHGGARTERALRALSELARLSPPAELAQAIEGLARDSAAPVPHLGRAPAPRVLDRLVDEELQDPSKALVRRHVGGLARLEAPASLAERVARDFAHAQEDSRARLALRRVFRRRLELALGAAAVFAVFIGVWALQREPVSPPRPFRVEHASNFGALSPLSRGLLDSASSGMFGGQRS